MITPNVVYGDIIELGLNGQFDVIVQGCNCMNQMGKGLALQLRRTIPECYQADLETDKGDYNKLGTISYAIVGDLTVVNAYTQFDWRGATDGTVLSYPWAVVKAMKEVKKLWTGKRIAYPKIGCGLANGNWDEMYPLILEALEGEDQTLVLPITGGKQ